MMPTTELFAELLAEALAEALEEGEEGEEGAEGGGRQGFGRGESMVRGRGRYCRGKRCLRVHACKGERG